MPSLFTPAVRERQYARVALDGAPGGGKTFTAISLGHQLAETNGGPVFVIDTENGSSALYSGMVVDNVRWDFNSFNMVNNSPQSYSYAIQEAYKEAPGCLIIDSLSHAWAGVEGALEKVGGDWSKWKDVTPELNRLVNLILKPRCHVIVTLRSKVEYLPQSNAEGKISSIQRIGTAPVMRKGIEYEFDLCASINRKGNTRNHEIDIYKSRCNLMDGLAGIDPGRNFWLPFVNWLNWDQKEMDASAFLTGMQNPSEPWQHRSIIELCRRISTPEKLANAMNVMFQKARLSQLNFSEASKLENLLKDKETRQQAHARF